MRRIGLRFCISEVLGWELDRTVFGLGLFRARLGWAAIGFGLTVYV